MSYFSIDDWRGKYGTKKYKDNRESANRITLFEYYIKKIKNRWGWGYETYFIPHGRVKIFYRNYTYLDYYGTQKKWGKWKLEKSYTVKHGLIDGKEVIKHKNRVIKSIRFHRGGKLHGESKYYYASGNLKRVCHYKNAMLVDTDIEYFDKVEKRIKSKLVINKKYKKPQGLFTSHHSNGRLSIKRYFNKFGIPHGELVKFDNRGNLEFKCTFDNGIIVGDVVYEYKPNRLFSKNNRYRKHFYFGKNGKPVPEEIVYDSKNNLVRKRYLNGADDYKNKPRSYYPSEVKTIREWSDTKFLK
jgi:antitoxin component YwqK of YwqJK toxin-antitoxin module